MSSADLEKRIIDLEVKVSFQETTIETLNQVVTDQEKRIAELKAEVTRLAEQNRELTPGTVIPDDDEPPPHY